MMTLCRYCYAECPYAECPYAECRKLAFLLRVVILSVVAPPLVPGESKKGTKILEEFQLETRNELKVFIFQFKKICCHCMTAESAFLQYT